MIGFELEIQEKKTSASIAEGVLSLIVTRVKNHSEDDIHLHFTGMDTKDGEKHIDWKVTELKEG